MENLEIYKREYYNDSPPRQPSLRFNNDQFMTNLFHRCCCHCYSVTESFLTLCNPMDFSWSGSFVHGILQARILEWVAISFSRVSSQPRRNLVFCIAGRFVTAEPPGKTLFHLLLLSRFSHVRLCVTP